MAETKTKTRVKKDKYDGFTVPTKKGAASVRACVHTYEMIKEANVELLKREDVKKAYNDFITCCRKYDGRLESWYPSKSYKYTQNIKLKEPSTNQYYLFRGLNFRWNDIYHSWNDPVKKDTIIDDTENIINSYIVLYDLIKRDVVPYVELKEWERTRTKTLEGYNSQIANHEDAIKAYEKYISDCRTKICDLAKRAIEASKPPEPTKFD
jgi:hypothetical protein